MLITKYCITLALEMSMDYCTRKVSLGQNHIISIKVGLARKVALIGKEFCNCVMIVYAMIDDII